MQSSWNLQKNPCFIYIFMAFVGILPTEFSEKNLSSNFFHQPIRKPTRNPTEKHLEVQSTGRHAES